MSIKTWSDVEHSYLSMTDMERLQYNIEARHWVANWNHPGWYRAILQFYRLLWQEVIRLGLDDDMKQYASEIEAKLKSYPNASKATLTVSSLMDTHLWLASGNLSLLTTK